MPTWVQPRDANQRFVEADRGPVLEHHVEDEGENRRLWRTRALRGEEGGLLRAAGGPDPRTFVLGCRAHRGIGVPVDPDHVVAELLGDAFGMVHVLPSPTHIDADQMSLIRAADPCGVCPRSASVTQHRQGHQKDRPGDQHRVPITFGATADPVPCPTQAAGVIGKVAWPTSAPAGCDDGVAVGRGVRVDSDDVALEVAHGGRQIGHCDVLLTHRLGVVAGVSPGEESRPKQACNEPHR